MIITRLKLPLDEAELAALLATAERELRSPADQVRYLLREALQRRGLLPGSVEPVPVAPGSQPQPQEVCRARA